MQKKNLIEVPYDLFREKGTKGLVNWFEEILIEDENGLLDPCKVHVNEKTFGKIYDAIWEWAKTIDKDVTRSAVGMWLVNYGPSGGDKDIPDDYCMVDAEWLRKAN